MTFKVGDKVKLAHDSPYYLMNNLRNPRDTIGVVLLVSSVYYTKVLSHSHTVHVSWPYGNHEYRFFDLIKVG